MANLLHILDIILPEPPQNKMLFQQQNMEPFCDSQYETKLNILNLKFLKVCDKFAATDAKKSWKN